jgi:hypothetical protein
MTLSLKNDVNVASKSTVISKKTFEKFTIFCCRLEGSATLSFEYLFCSIAVVYALSWHPESGSVLGLLILDPGARKWIKN